MIQTDMKRQEFSIKNRPCGIRDNPAQRGVHQHRKPQKRPHLNGLDESSVTTLATSVTDWTMRDRESWRRGFWPSVYIAKHTTSSCQWDAFTCFPPPPLRSLRDACRSWAPNIWRQGTWVATNKHFIPNTWQQGIGTHSNNDIFLSLCRFWFHTLVSIVGDYPFSITCINKSYMPNSFTTQAFTLADTT